MYLKISKIKTQTSSTMHVYIGEKKNGYRKEKREERDV
jgi:hypothetical protein